MIKVKWLKSHPAFGYFEGDTGMVTPGWAQKLLASGHILLIPEESTDFKLVEPTTTTDSGNGPGEVVNTLPEDLPGREKLFAAGFDTAEKVKEVSGGDALLDVGISVTMLKKIKKYFKA